MVDMGPFLSPTMESDRYSHPLSPNAARSTPVGAYHPAAVRSVAPLNEALVLHRKGRGSVSLASCLHSSIRSTIKSRPCFIVAMLAGDNLPKGVQAFCAATNLRSSATAVSS